MKKIRILATLALAMLLTVLPGCDRGRNIPGSEQEDPTKTQLYICTYDGGYGIEWLNKAKLRFEEEYADVSFEEGKKGVQIFVKEDTNATGTMLEDSLPKSSYDIYFTEAVSYYDMVNKGLTYDITDVVQNPLNYDFQSKKIVDGESATIESKMRDAHTSYFKTEEGKYFAIPFYEATYGIIYNIDLFEENLLYFAQEGYGDGDGFITSLDDPRSAGPDNDITTEDDNGLPATYDEFFALCDKMVGKGITPLLWGGTVQHYVNELVNSLQADYEGAEQMRINYTFDGTATNLVESINSDGTVKLYSEKITEENGYLTWTKQAGRYYGIKFVERMLGKSNYFNSKKSFSITDYSHIDAQYDFVLGKYEREEFGMLIDGTWWHNEAKNAFSFGENRYDKSAGSANRKFGFMPLPKATKEQVGEGYTVLEANNSVCFINANINEAKVSAAKEFLQFCHTNESLAEFTVMTNACKPYTYTLDSKQLESMPYWGRSIYKMHQSATFVSTYSTSPVYKRNASALTTGFQAEMFWTKVGGEDYNKVTTAIRDYKLTAEQYFNGLSAYLTPNEWNKNFLN